MEGLTERELREMTTEQLAERLSGDEPVRKGGWAPNPEGVKIVEAAIKEEYLRNEERRGEKERKREELAAWWQQQAMREVDGVVDKAIEYGAADLKVMGKAMESLIVGKGSMVEGEVPERVGIELAIAFYALGKVARLFGAYERGELPSDDCWADLGIYTRMAQHVREKGRWP